MATPNPKIEPLNKLKITVEFLDGTPVKGSDKEHEIIGLLISSGIVDQVGGKYLMMYHYNDIVCLKTL